jgi:outer membrane protein insertion porin family
LKRRSSSSSCLASPTSQTPLSPVRTGSIVHLFAVLTALLGLVGVVWPAPFDELKVAAIEVRGNQRISAAAVVNTSGLSEGQVYPYEEVRGALKRVYEMGFFDDVRLYVRELPEGHELTVEVVERPVIGAIRISGNRKVGKGDIREKIALGVGSSLEARLVFESMAAIMALYREKGYYIATVDFDVEDVNETTANLIFKIDEGVKVKVGDIRIAGNEHLSDDAVRKAMETKERGWFSRKDYNPQVFEEDIERIGRLYKDEGFMNAQVVSHEIDIDKEEALADLTITVDEGPRTYVKRVAIELEAEGDVKDVISEEVLAAGVGLEPGEPYSQAAFDRTLENLYSILGDQGFVYAQITPEEATEDDSLTLTLRVQPQRAVRVNKIIIEGNETTFEKVIRRELVIRPGDILRRSMIERSHREVFNLGFFEDVQVSSRPANEEGDIDLIFQIKERQIGIANVGAGYSEEFGLTGFVEFSHNNVGWFRKFPYLGLGKGQTINLRWEFGKLAQIELSYRDPWFRDRPTLVGFDIYNTKREYDTYTERRAGLGGVFGKRIPYIDYSRFYIRYRLERRELDPDEAKASAAVISQAGAITTSSTVVTFIRNSVDNPFFPRVGSQTRITAEWAGGLLGGTTAYQSYTVENSNFLPVPAFGSALLFRMRLGLVDELGRSGYIPIYERFRLGGTTIDGIRGYSEREIVPEGNAIDEGGRFMVIGSVEYRVPIVRNRAHVLAFFDAGDTWNSFRAARPGFLKRSLGAGFRIEIPIMGQLGLDIAYGFDRLDRYGGPGWKTHFQFGTAGY